MCKKLASVLILLFFLSINFASAYYYDEAIKLGTVVSQGKPTERQLGLSGLIEKKQEAGIVVSYTKISVRWNLRNTTTGVFCQMKANDTNNITATLVQGADFHPIKREWDTVYDSDKFHSALYQTEMELTAMARSGTSIDLINFETVLKKYWNGCLWEVFGKDGKTYLLTAVGFHLTPEQDNLGLGDITWNPTAPGSLGGVWDQDNSKIKVFTHGQIKICYGCPLEETLTQNRIDASRLVQIQ